METQIQAPPITHTNSSKDRERERHLQQVQTELHHRKAVECIMEGAGGNADGNSSPLCLSINNSVGERQRVRIKYISCDEDNNPVEHSPKQL